MADFIYKKLHTINIYATIQYTTWASYPWLYCYTLTLLYSALAKRNGVYQNNAIRTLKKLADISPIVIKDGKQELNSQNEGKNLLRFQGSA